MADTNLMRPNRRPALTGRLPFFSAKPPMRWAAALGVLFCALAVGFLVHGGSEGAQQAGKRYGLFGGADYRKGTDRPLLVIAPDSSTQRKQLFARHG